MKRVRIGNGCGFWGDNLDAPLLLAQVGKLDYLTLEYLAELTMSILALQKQRDPQAGFATDFLQVLQSLIPILQAQPKLKIVTNAGGMNPNACAAKAREILDKAGLSQRNIAIVTGDDLLPRLDQILAAGHALANMDTGAPLSDIRPRIVSANAYVGSRPIAEALKRGASIVITGRVADAALTVAPLVHEFGWRWDDWDRLCAASVAGHLLECGAQATGGLWCNWQEMSALANVGYPIVEAEEDGSFTISKPFNSGGAVNEETVTEQLLYEVGDPAAYLTPDVTADFTTVNIFDFGNDFVGVGNAHGKPATDSYKVSIAYRDGWTASGTLLIAGPDAVAKAKKCGAVILERLARADVVPERSHVECLG
ncbi:MAG: acyclic terpene utilization AtuA family protein, partial [Candidatus Acidiferrum sp.]